MFETLGGRHPATTVLHEEVGDKVLKRSSAWIYHGVALCLFTLALADIGSNSGSSKSKRTLSCKEHINFYHHWLPAQSVTSDVTYLTILLKVSASVSPMNGENPERRM